MVCFISWIWHLGRSSLTGAKPGEMAQRRSQRYRMEGHEYGNPKDGKRHGKDCERLEEHQQDAKLQERRRGNIKGRRRQGECWSSLCVCVTVHLCDTHTDNTKADNTAHCPRSNRHTPSAHWAIYCPSARRRHVRSHAAPRAEGTLVRDMRNVIRKRWCRPRSCPRRAGEAGYRPQEPVVFGC